MEDFLCWRAQKFNISYLLLFPLTLTTASAVLTVISGGKSTSSCCSLLSCPGLSLMPSRSTCQSQQIGWKVRTAIISTSTFFFFLLPFIPFSVLPQSHQKCKYSGMIYPQRWLKFTKKFYFIFARKKLGFKHLEWLTFIPSWKNWVNENKCASTKSVFLSSSACPFISLGCACRRMVRKNI